ncbi:IS630 family transposase [bacterium]|nr:IS630 family transposase [bacterium]
MLILNNRKHLKKRHRLARQEDIDLWSLDECHFQQHGSRIAMWVPPEDKDPILLMAPTRKSISLFGAVNLKDGRLMTQFEKKFDAMTFMDFLKYLLRHRKKDKKMVVILDNARYHHANLLHPFIKKNRKKLSLEFLPPYSPELNPIERVWKLTRKLCIHDNYFENLDDLVDAVTKQHALWKKPNGTLRKLCCIT